MQIRSLALASLAAGLVTSAASAQQYGAVLFSFPAPANATTPVGLDSTSIAGVGPDIYVVDLANDTWDTVNGSTGISTGPTISVAPNTGSPIGITRDVTNVYVTDTTDDDVDIYDTAGVYISSIPVATETTFPEGVAWSLINNHLYVVDGTASEIEEYDLNVTPPVHVMTYPVNGSSLDGIAHDVNTNTFWVYDSGTDSIRNYDASFVEIGSIPGTAFYGFGTGEGLAFVNNIVYVCATGQDTIVAFNVDPNSPQPAVLTAVAEPTLNTGTLGAGPLVEFDDGDFLRWEMGAGSSTAVICAVVANFANGQTPTGVTPGLPGFNQLNTLSGHPGAEVILPPYIVGNQHSFQVPAGFFGFAEGIRIQGLTLEPTLSPIPALATGETINLFRRFNATCSISEDFEAVANGLGSYPLGWATGAGGTAWTCDSGGTTSTATGPNTGANATANYMYCETSGSGGTATFIMDSAVYSAAGISNLKFVLSRVGASIGTLEVRMGDGTGTFPTVLATFTGPVAGEWNLVNLLFTAPATGNVQFQFHYVAGGTFTGDIAIDEICLY